MRMRRSWPQIDKTEPDHGCRKNGRRRPKEPSVWVILPFCSHQIAWFQQCSILAGGCQKCKLAGKRQAELLASEWREVASQVSLATGMPSESSKIKHFFSIALEWFKAFPRDWLFLKSHSKFEKNSPERSRAVCARPWELRSSVIFATNAHCKCNSLRSAAARSSTCRVAKSLVWGCTPLRITKGIGSEYFRSHFGVVWRRFFFFAFPTGPRHWNNRFLRLGALSGITLWTVSIPWRSFQVVSLFLNLFLLPLSFVNEARPSCEVACTWSLVGPEANGDRAGPKFRVQQTAPCPIHWMQAELLSSSSSACAARDLKSTQSKTEEEGKMSLKRKQNSDFSLHWNKKRWFFCTAKCLC